MNNYLCILLRSQFTLWYRFGYIQLHKSQMIAFEGEIHSKINKENIFHEFVENIPFEYDEEYLIFHIEAEENNSQKQNIEIQQIKAIYPLTENARSSISHKIDQRIKLAIPFFNSSEIDKLEKLLDKKERKKAIPILWDLCGIEKDYKIFLDKLGLKNLENAIQLRSEGQKISEIHQGHYIDYLYTYDRTEYYESQKIGYFQDAVAILSYYTFPSFPENKGNLLSAQQIENRAIFKFLLKIKEKDSFKIISRNVETQEKYIENSIINGLDFHIITPLFLILKNDMQKNNNDLSRTLLMNTNRLKELEEYGDNFYLAIILFAYFFGYKYVYDAYYSKINLNIFSQSETKYLKNNEITDSISRKTEKKENKRSKKITEDPEKRKEIIVDEVSRTPKDQNGGFPINKILKKTINKSLQEKGFRNSNKEEVKGYYPHSDIKKVNRTDYFYPDGYPQKSLLVE